jgi:pimeloyl-ACP methyl ester carboxylesterase
MSDRTIRPARRFRARCLLTVVFVPLLLAGGWLDAAGSPILLLYGFQPVPGFYAPQVWLDFAERLSGRPADGIERILLDSEHDLFFLPQADGEHFDVFVSDYGIPLEPTIRDLRFYARRVADEIAYITERLAVPSVSLVGHSMGGLIARCYVEAADFAPVLGQPGFPDYGTVYRGDVDTLVTLATPHHGATVAALGPWVYGVLSEQLAPESRLLAQLNRGEKSATALESSVRYVSMAGQSCLGCGIRRDEDACIADCIRDALAWTGSDLVIMMDSAWLPYAENVACIGFDHVDMHTHTALADLLHDVLRGRPAPLALYGSDDIERAAAAR